MILEPPIISKSYRDSPPPRDVGGAELKVCNFKSNSPWEGRDHGRRKEEVVMDIIKEVMRCDLAIKCVYIHAVRCLFI